MRWKPQDYNAQPEYLVSGSYSEKENSLDLWYYPTNKELEDEEDEIYMHLPVHSMLVKRGDVTGLMFHERDKFIYSTSQGVVAMVGLDKKKMKMLNEWELKGEAAGFDVDISSRKICIFGESAVFFGLDSDSSIGIIENNNLKCGSFLRQDEIVVGNLRGQLFVYDLRTNLKPTMAFPYNSESAVGVTCVRPYPNQKHILVATGLDGNVTTWDLRKHVSPTDLYLGHDSPISHFQFSDRRPNNMFTTCYSGEMWHWTNFDMMLAGSQPDVRALLDRKKYPTNYCDVYNDHLVAATDNDCLVIVSPLKLV